MKKIEVRAEEYMNNYPNMDDSYYDYYVKDGYIQGAIEQRQIDIDKACEWFRIENSHAPAGWVEMEIEKLKQAMEE